MKNLIVRANKKLIALVCLVSFCLASCDLEPEVFSEFTPETYYANEFQVLSALSGVYRNFSGIPGMGVEYRCLELCTDQVVVHGKIQGWWANSSFEGLAQHTWDESHAYVNGTWNTLFRTVGQANGLIASLEATESSDIVIGAIAEMRVLRAYAYFFLMDLFGNVPLFTEPKVDNNNLPTTNSRAEIFAFVVSELKEALDDLPSKNNVGDEYYGRLTKEAAYSLLATVYLNAEVYKGSPEWGNAITYADLVINSGAYTLLPDYFDNFVYNNENNAEFIFGGVYTPDVTGGPGHPLVQKVLPGISGGLFGLPYTPQNGFGTRPSVVNLYADGDDRKSMFFLPGPLVDPTTGEVVMVERIVPDNNSVLYKPGESTEGPVPYEIINATGLRNQPMNAGIKWIKWGLDPNTNGGNAGNDIAFSRYADVLLIKAEALFRTGDSGGALALINEVRERSNADLLTTLTEDDVLAERGRELAFEMSRRRDLIRFDKFGQAWEFKEASEGFRKLFPIPQAARDANPNLKQNPGYNGG